MDRPDEQPRPLPLAELGADAVAADERARSRRIARRTVLSLGCAAGIAWIAGFKLWGQKPSDDMSDAMRRQLRAAMANASLGPTRIDMTDPQQMEAARQSLQLPPAEADRMIADARAGKMQMGWVSLRDFLDEDGDIAQISIGGFTRTVPLKNAPTPVAIPIVPGDFLRVTGLVDGGGGGVTVGITTGGGAEVQMPLDVGETITLPVR
jgi:hypothetical protein